LEIFAQKILINSTSSDLVYNNPEFAVEISATDKFSITNSKIKAKSITINGDGGIFNGLQLVADNEIHFSSKTLTISETTVIKCEKIIFANDITLFIEGNVVFNCNEVDFGSRKIFVKRKLNAQFANFQVRYKKLTVNGEQALIPDGDVKLISVIKQ
jgi:hypothetical protein